MCPKDADRMANSGDPLIRLLWSSLIWVYTVCPNLSVQKLRIITVGKNVTKMMWVCLPKKKHLCEFSNEWKKSFDGGGVLSLMSH